MNEQNYEQEINLGKVFCYDDRGHRRGGEFRYEALTDCESGVYRESGGKLSPGTDGF